MASGIISTLPLEEKTADTVPQYIHWCNTPLLPGDAAMLRSNPQAYWKHYAKMHASEKALSDFALTLLSMSATEMDCEREFSRIAWIVGDYRANLNDNRIIALSLLNVAKAKGK
jgi:hypothetical protein